MLALSEEDIKSCLQFFRNSFENYKKRILLLVAACDEFNKPMISHKLEVILQDLKDRFKQDNQSAIQLDEVLSELLNQCKSINQLIYLMNFDNFIHSNPMEFMYKKGLLEEFIEKASLTLVKRYLPYCNDPKTYFALKVGYQKQNKYSELLNILGPKEKERMEYVVDNEFKKQPVTLLDIKFKTKIIDSEGNAIKFSIYDIHKKREGCPIYEIRTDSGGKLGDISLIPSDGYMYVHFINSFAENNGKKAYSNVGRALHEFAIQESFRKDFNGQVHLKADYGSDVFHFLCGFRYENMGYTINEPNIIAYLEMYHKAKKAGDNTEEILKKIENLKSENQEDMLITVAFDNMKHQAKKVLKKEPQNMQEIIEYGAFYDRNKELQRKIDNDPIRHEKLGPLITQYHEAKKNGQSPVEIVKQFEVLMKENDEHLNKIFKKMKKLATNKLDGDREPHMEEILDKGYKKLRASDGGNMRLSNEAIEKWKQALGINVS